jgi:hypothetical protein
VSMCLHSFKRYLGDYEINLQWGNYGPNWGPGLHFLSDQKSLFQ